MITHIEGHVVGVVTAHPQMAQQQMALLRIMSEVNRLRLLQGLRLGQFLRRLALGQSATNPLRQGFGLFTVHITNDGDDRITRHIVLLVEFQQLLARNPLQALAVAHG